MSECVCVTLVIKGGLSVFLMEEGPGILLLTWSNKARQQDGIVELATPTYLPPVSLKLVF